MPGLSRPSAFLTFHDRLVEVQTGYKCLVIIFFFAFTLPIFYTESNVSVKESNKLMQSIHSMAGEFKKVEIRSE